LLGQREGQEALVEWLINNVGYTIFGIATGRPLDSAIDILRKNRIPIPDVLITSVGSEIHYGIRRTPDIGWANHIRHLWRRDDVLKAMQQIPGIRLQTAENQREFKISYLVDAQTMPTVDKISQHLHALGRRSSTRMASFSTCYRYAPLRGMLSAIYRINGVCR